MKYWEYIPAIVLGHYSTTHAAKDNVRNIGISSNGFSFLSAEVDWLSAEVFCCSGFLFTLVSLGIGCWWKMYFQGQGSLLARHGFHSLLCRIFSISWWLSAQLNPSKSFEAMSNCSVYDSRIVSCFHILYCDEIIAFLSNRFAVFWQTDLWSALILWASDIQSWTASIACQLCRILCVMKLACYNLSRWRGI